MELVFYVMWFIFWYTVGGVLGGLFFDWMNSCGRSRR